MSFSIIVSVGKYGGFNWHDCLGETTDSRERRICLGWVAFSLLTPEWDVYLSRVGDRVEEIVRKKNQKK